MEADSAKVVIAQDTREAIRHIARLDEVAHLVHTDIGRNQLTDTCVATAGGAIGRIEMMTNVIFQR